MGEAGMRDQLYRAGFVCVNNAIEQLVEKCRTQLPMKGVAKLRRSLKAMRKQFEIFRESSDGEPRFTFPQAKQLETLLPDPDSLLHAVLGWGCAVDSVIDLARFLAKHMPTADAACDTFGLAYETCTRFAIQEALRVIRRAVDERQLLKIEESLPECREAVRFQLAVLNAE
jgi:hypothetical protein